MQTQLFKPLLTARRALSFVFYKSNIYHHQPREHQTHVRAKLILVIVSSVRVVGSTVLFSTRFASTLATRRRLGVRAPMLLLLMLMMGSGVRPSGGRHGRETTTVLRGMLIVLMLVLVTVPMSPCPLRPSLRKILSRRQA